MSGPLGQTTDQNDTPGNDATVEQSSPRYLAIGRVTRAHGVRGEISVVVLTEFPERFDTTEWVYLGNEMEADAYRVKKHRWHKINVLLTLEGVTDRTAAEQLRGLLVQVPVEDAVPLPEGSYYLYQVIGLPVFTTEGERLGVLSNMLETKANNVYVVLNENGKEILLPVISDVVKSIDLQKGQIVVELIEGLI